MPEFFRGDPARLRQVLTNLIGNAIKFTESGSVSVMVVQALDGVIKFDIADTGIGIPKERLSSIFDPFTQADDSINRRYGGTGLGTTISYQLVQLMGGEISVTSELGKGSCFSFTLKLEKGSYTPPSASSEIPVLSPLRILVADDIPQNIELMKVRLSALGHSVMTASNGLEAVDLHREQRPDLILMDVQMPEMDGLTACRTIRRYEAENNLPRTPVVALTASVLEEDKRAAADAGMEGFSTKPVDFAALMTEVARVLNISISEFRKETVVAGKSGHINVAKGLKIWGQMGLYVTQLRDFSQRYSDLPARLTVMLAMNRTADAQALAHAAKGVAGNLAITELRDLCSDIENALRKADADQSERSVARMRAIWPEILAACNSTGMTERGTENDLKEVDLLILLSALGELLEHHNFDDDILEKLQNYSGEHVTEVSAVVALINDFEFERAAEQVAELLQQLNDREIS